MTQSHVSNPNVALIRSSTYDTAIAVMPPNECPPIDSLSYSKTTFDGKPKLF